MPMKRPGPALAPAIGDAHNLPLEYRRGNIRRLNTGRIYVWNGNFTDMPKGVYSDDTQQNIAMLEIVQLFRKTGVMPTARDIAARLTLAYARDQRPGYSTGMKLALEKAVSTYEPLDLICQRYGRSPNSGAAMRATSVGLLPNIKTLLELTRIQGNITHSGNGVKAAEAAALAAHYMLYKLGPRSQMPAFVARYTGQAIWTRPWRGPVGSPGMESTRAALTAVVEASSLRDLLIRTAAYTGDVDTVGAIAMGAAWAYADLPNDLPLSLWEGLENGPYGRDYLAALDDQLLTAFDLTRR